MRVHAERAVSVTRRVGKGRLVDAVVIPEVDLGTTADLRNIVTFLGACLEECVKGVMTADECAAMAGRCAGAMERLRDRPRPALSVQVGYVLHEATMEAQEIRAKLADTSRHLALSSEEYRAWIEAKAYKVHYLSNILTAELVRLKITQS
jgi:hypothetical protein